MEQLKAIWESIRSNIPPVHPDGWPFVALAGLLALFGFFLWTPLGWVLAGLTIYVAYFFRDPVRVSPTRPGAIVSPADGRVIMVGEAVPPEELGMGPEARPHIAVFLSVFDVHVNRSPAEGQVRQLAYREGAFFNADLDKASEDNERMAMKLTLPDGQEIACVQIAGFVARRIVCKVKEGDALKAGERYGLIRFGSRVDVYLPRGIVPLVAVGQRAVAGETLFADLFNQPPQQSYRSD